MNSPLVSVIIPVYNASKFIENTIKSVLTQNYSKLEIIIIDDGSTDTTKDVVKSIKDSRIEYVFQQNQTQAIARNVGINRAKGKFIAFIDSDDLWEPNKIEKQLSLFDNPEIGLVYSNLSYIDEKGLSLKKSVPIMYKGMVAEKLIITNFIANSSVVARKNLLLKNNIFFRKKRQGVEDWDIWLRLAVFAKFDYSKDKLLKYRIHEENISKNIEAQYTGRMLTLDECLIDYLYYTKNKNTLLDKNITNYIKAFKKSKFLYTLIYGHDLLMQGKKEQSKIVMRKAIALNPFQPRCYWGFLKSYFRLIS